MVSVLEGTRSPRADSPVSRSQGSSAAGAANNASGLAAKVFQATLAASQAKSASPWAGSSPEVQVRISARPEALRARPSSPLGVSEAGGSSIICQAIPASFHAFAAEWACEMAAPCSSIDTLPDPSNASQAQAASIDATAAFSKVSMREILAALLWVIVVMVASPSDFFYLTPQKKRYLE